MWGHFKVTDGNDWLFEATNRSDGSLEVTHRSDEVLWSDAQSSARAHTFMYLYLIEF